MRKDIQNNNKLIEEIKGFINEAKESVAITANSALTILHWNIGHRINNETSMTKIVTKGHV